MVYCGKPSRACHACRKRNTRCDAKPGGCTQCKAAHRECPGYRDQVDLMFRDQTSRVTQSIRSREVKRRGKTLVSANKITPEPTSTAVTLRNYYRDLARRQPLRPISIQPSLEDCATCYFITNHVVGMHSINVGFLNSLNHMYKTRTAEPCLISSVTAASLASFAHYTKNDSLDATARQHYTKAISLTNAALGDPEDVKKDSTLVSVLVLGQYEFIAGDSERSKEAYEEHTNGAAALLKVRGAAQLKSPFGQQLLMEVMRNIMSTCFWRSIRVPEHIADLTRRAFRSIPNFSTLGIVYDALIAASDFHAFVRSTRSVDHRDVVARAFAIDRPLADICTHPPAGRSFQTFYDDTADPEVIFKGQYNACDLIGWSNLWSAIRTIRILLHEGTQDSLIQSFSSASSTTAREEHISQFRESRAVCEQMRMEILASVPQHLGYICKVDGKFVLTADPVTWPARCYSMIWPLWVAGRHDATADVREYCIRSAEEIGNRMGIQQGLVLARALKERGRMMSGDFKGADRWSRFQALVAQSS